MQSTDVGPRRISPPIGHEPNASGDGNRRDGWVVVGGGVRKETERRRKAGRKGRDPLSHADEDERVSWISQGDRVG